MQEIRSPFRKFATFKGRATRKEYWLFVALQIVLLFSLGSISAILQDFTGTAISLGQMFLAVVILMAIPSLAVTVRRLHDTNHAGTWVLVYFVPLVGGIWLLILLLYTGTKGTNKYGADPREKSIADAEGVLDFEEASNR